MMLLVCISAPNLLILPYYGDALFCQIAKAAGEQTRVKFARLLLSQKEKLSEFFITRGKVAHTDYLPPSFEKNAVH